jgi:hypothetical protein
MPNDNYTCTSAADGTAILSAGQDTITFSGKIAEQFAVGEVYSITVTYVGDKPPHP